MLYTGEDRDKLKSARTYWNELADDLAQEIKALIDAGDAEAVYHKTIKFVHAQQKCAQCEVLLDA